MKYPIKNYLQAIKLWATIWDICWWNKNNDQLFYFCDCKLAWDVAKGIWLED